MRLLNSSSVCPIPWKVTGRLNMVLIPDLKLCTFTFYTTKVIKNMINYNGCVWSYIMIGAKVDYSDSDKQKV